MRYSTKAVSFHCLHSEPMRQAGFGRSWTHCSTGAAAPKEADGGANIAIVPQTSLESARTCDDDDPRSSITLTRKRHPGIPSWRSYGIKSRIPFWIVAICTWVLLKFQLDNFVPQLLLTFSILEHELTRSSYCPSHSIPNFKGSFV